MQNGPFQHNYFPLRYFPNGYFPGTVFVGPLPPPISGTTRPWHNMTETTLNSLTPTIIVPVPSPVQPGYGCQVIVIQNTSNIDIFIGSATVTASGPNTGIVVKGGLTPPDKIELPFCGATYAIAASGDPVVVVDQIY